VRWAVLVLLLAGCAARPHTIAVPLPPATCPVGGRMIAPPPAPRTVEALAAWGEATQHELAITREALAICRRRLYAMAEAAERR
jgi:hypothetical protein